MGSDLQKSGNLRTIDDSKDNSEYTKLCAELIRPYWCYMLDETPVARTVWSYYDVMWKGRDECLIHWSALKQMEHLSNQLCSNIADGYLSSHGQVFMNLFLV